MKELTLKVLGVLKKQYASGAWDWEVIRKIKDCQDIDALQAYASKLSKSEYIAWVIAHKFKDLGYDHFIHTYLGQIYDISSVPLGHLQPMIGEFFYFISDIHEPSTVTETVFYDPLMDEELQQPFLEDYEEQSGGLFYPDKFQEKCCICIIM